MPDSVRRTVIDLVRLLEKNKIAYVAAGALPVQCYGREPFSRDVDVVPRLDGEKRKRLLDILHDERYQIIYPSEREHELAEPKDLADLHLIKLKDRNTGSFIDIVLKPEGFRFDAEVEKRARRIFLEGKRIVIPSPEDYLAMKLTTRRAGTHDFEDIISTLTSQYDRLDWKYLYRRARDYGFKGLLDYYKEAIQDKIKWK